MEQQPGIDKKAVAAILLCALIWAVWMNSNYRRTQQLAAKRAAQQQTQVATTGTGGTLALTTGTGGAVALATPGGTPAQAELGPPTTVRLANRMVVLEVSSAGARPVDAELSEPERKRFHDDAGEVLEDLVPPRVEGAEKLAPLAPWFGDADGSRIPADARFETLAKEDNLARFRWTSPDGNLSLTRTWKSAGPDATTLELVEEYENRPGAPEVKGRPGLVWVTHDKTGKIVSKTGAFEPGAAVNDRFQFKTPKAPGDEKRTYSGPVDFVAVHDRYFTAIAAPVEPRFDGQDSVRFRRPAEKTLLVLGLGDEVTLGAGEKKTFTYEIYIGAKDYAILREEGHNFGRVMNWGQGQGFFWAFVGLITKGLWYALRWFHSLVGNWGLAIIALTFVMRGLLWPLAARQMRMANEFAAKSAKLKPQIDRLREKYAEDPMEMNRQTMALYKQYGISPFSPLAGCLPLLLQLPIWWALYRVLYTSIDLRGAQFYLWIHDLSAPETFFTIGTFDFRLMPVLLGAVTWLQMKITPQAGTDPAQQKMMQWMMPAMFTFFMWSLPAGLVVYIFTSTLMGIAQQWLLKRAMNRPRPEPGTPEAGRTEAT